MRPGSKSRSRRRSAVGLLAAVLTAGMVSATPSEAGAPSTDGSGGLTPELAARFADDDRDPTVAFWVDLRAEADLSAAAQVRSWRGRGRAVVSALSETARDSQHGVIARLDRANVDYQSFHISNTVYVPHGTERLAEQLAARPEVAAVRADHTYTLPEPAPATEVSTDDPVEWGIAAIHADQVWSDFGVRGEGIVVGSIDSGAQFDHPALVDSYRGNRGGGSFDHDYNWFDPTGVCTDAAPCDNNGHGTHTIGTMVGDGGPGHHIGVAPGAQWIAAKGCEGRTCSEQALMASAEFMLAPTDTAGNNPRPELRPHVVNNSWGNDNGPIVEPWFSDIVDAWIAAGIFPMFSGGNAGPACATAGSPGDYPQSYAAGAFDVDGRIASFSSRGSISEPDIKPNIAAPGVAVTSAAPGDAYAAMNGTSMASPHVAGAIALMWSASPQLARDIDATRTILDRTAVDVDQTGCGGTAEDNYVFGEGRLDALAAVTASPIDNTGTVSGRITDAATGEPLAGSRIVIDGPLDRDLAAGTDGRYSIRLTTGEYRITASAFGYRPRVQTVTITDGGSVTADLTLAKAPSATISGVVADGSGHGWPLYARIDIDGVPAGPWFTDPETGRYNITLPATASYRMRVEPVYPGYQLREQDVDFRADATVDLTLPISTERCMAPGYGVRGLFEPFQRPDKPAGWTLVDRTGDGGWVFDDPDPLGNRTPGGAGNFASISSQFYASDDEQDADLISPVVDLSATTDPVIALQTQYFAPAWTDSTATIDLSVDGGSTWSTVWTHASPTVTDVLNLPIPQAAGKAEVQVRFTYTGGFDMWWEVDDVLIGEPECRPLGGGLVVGRVSDSNTDDGLGGSTVASRPDQLRPARTVATPDDPQVGDGLFWAFVPGGERTLTAAHDEFADQTATVAVRADTVVRQDFSLAAGHLRVDPAPVRSQQGIDEVTRHTVTLTNDGTAPLTVQLGEHGTGGDADTDIVDGQGADAVRSGGANDAVPTISVRTPGVTGPLHAGTAGTRSLLSAEWPEARPAAATPGELPMTPGEWDAVDPYPTGIMDPAVATDGDAVHSAGGFDGEGSTTAAYRYDAVDDHWSPLPDMSIPRQSAAAGFVDGRFIVAGGWGTSIELVPVTEIYDPATGSWSKGAPAPHGYAATGHAVLNGELYLVGGCSTGNGTMAGDCGRTAVEVYDPATDHWSTAADYPLSVSHAMCGAIAGKLYCAGGMNSASEQIFDQAFVYDPVYDHWSPIADLPVPLYAGEGTATNGELLVLAGNRDSIYFSHVTNEGFAYHPGTDSWRRTPNLAYPLYRAGSACGAYVIGGAANGWPGMARTQHLAGYDDCGVGETDWLDVPDTQLTLQPGESSSVQMRIHTDAVDQPGSFTSAIPLAEDTPYTPDPIAVEVTVDQPRHWGAVTVTATGADCTGAGTPIQGAFVEVAGRGRTQLARKTDENGSATVHLMAQHRVTVIVSKDGWSADTTTVRIDRGRTTDVPITLTPAGGCR